MSSSSASQWMPEPRPIRRQRFRSADDACDNRGYHASGTEMLRPSLKSTESVSSDTVTFCANGASNSTAEVLIPCLHQFDSVISHQRFNPCNLDARKTTAALQPNGIKPELRNAVVSLHMNVLWFVAVTRIEEESVRARPQNCRQVVAPCPSLARQCLGTRMCCSEFPWLAVTRHVSAQAITARGLWVAVATPDGSGCYSDTHNASSVSSVIASTPVCRCAASMWASWRR